MSAAREKSWFASINLWLRAPPMCMYVPSPHNRFSALKIWREICRYPFVAWQCWSSGSVNSGYGATATGFLVILVSVLHFVNGECKNHLFSVCPRILRPRTSPFTSHATMSHAIGQHYLAEAVSNHAVFAAKERIGGSYAAAAFEKIFGKGS